MNFIGKLVLFFVFSLVAIQFVNGSYPIPDTLIAAAKKHPKEIYKMTSNLLNADVLSVSDKIEVLEAYTTSSFLLNKYDSTLLVANELKSIYQSQNDSAGLIGVINKTAVTYFSIGEYDKALENFLTAISLINGKDSVKLSHIHINLGLLYKDIDQMNDSKYHQKQAIKIGLLRHDSVIVSYGYNNLAAIYKAENKLDSAGMFYKKSLEIKQSLSDNDGIMNTLGNIGKLMLLQKQYDSAFAYMQKTLTMAVKQRNQVAIVTTLLSLGTYYHEISNNEQAIKSLQKGLQIADSIQHNPLKLTLYEYLSTFFADQKLYQQAYEYLKKHGELYAVMNQKEKVESIQRLHIQYRTKEQEQRFELLQKENIINQLEVHKQKRRVNEIVGFALIATVLMSLIFWQKHRHNKSLSLNNQSLEKKVEERTRLLEMEIITKEEKSIQLENALEEVKQVRKIKTAFLRNISHEIRTPLNAIIGFSGLITTEQNHKTRPIDITSIINENSEALLKIINNLIDLANLETNQFSIIKEKINTKKLVSDITALFNQLALKANKCAIEPFIDDFSDDIDIQVDNYRLMQILRTLIGNAFKYTHEGFVKLTFETKPDSICVTVADSGIGIPDEKKDVIFERYTLESDSLKKEGAGFDLSIAKAITRHMNGDLSLVKSSPDGSMFVLSLPIV